MHSYDIQLRRTDMDALEHLNNVVFAQYLDEARADLLARHDSGGEPWRVVVAGQRLGYRTPLTFRAEPVTVTSAVERIGTTSFTLRHEVRDADNVYLSAISTLVAVHDGAPRPLTDAERKYLADLTVRE
ncbi:thioesterase family protein [Nocardia huaxiensis]|uniref:Thioesterase family protein n=1 Tax=Nocardia huaxiensis TaxID=2755382 RepID=A0A7D6Z7F3_9NOCA|nr:thioesterase family protein [Nocardia huaxiensis]QLY28768.1 thioesterase family protein [Nocardia huaxiensis]